MRAIASEDFPVPVRFPATNQCSKSMRSRKISTDSGATSGTEGGATTLTGSTGTLLCVSLSGIIYQPDNSRNGFPHVLSLGFGLVVERTVFWKVSASALHYFFPIIPRRRSSVNKTSNPFLE